MDKSKIETNLQKLQLGSFSHQNISQIAIKIIATQSFFTDHWKRETVNKTSCRTPQQIIANYTSISWITVQVI